MTIALYILTAAVSFVSGFLCLLYLLYGRGWNDDAGWRAVAKKSERERSKLNP
jgi:hypothetical protein